MTSRYRVERSRVALRDLTSIFRFLIRSHMHFGETFVEAKGRATARIDIVKAAMLGLGKTPHQGTRRDALMPGLRHVTKDRVVFYFTVDDKARVVRVLAIFFGGQDHQREMLKRLRG